jgi:hypothetical protein
MVKALRISCVLSFVLLFAACNTTLPPESDAEAEIYTITSPAEVISREFMDSDGNLVPVPEDFIETQASDCSSSTRLFAVSSNGVRAETSITCRNFSGF